MNKPEIVVVIIGVVGALLSVYFRELIARAKERLCVAVTLESILYYWLNLGIQTDLMKKFIISGLALREKENILIQAGDINKIEEYRILVEKTLPLEGNNLLRKNETI